MLLEGSAMILRTISVKHHVPDHHRNVSKESTSLTMHPSKSSLQDSVERRPCFRNDTAEAATRLPSYKPQ